MLIYIVGLLVGNFLGRAIYRLGETFVLRIPIVRQIYPAVKQITDLFLADPKDKKGGGGGGSQFAGSRVVAVRYRDAQVWSVGLVTGNGVRALDDATGESLSVFIPSSPTAFSGYVVVVPRAQAVELPIGVDEAMRMLVSGGVVEPKPKPPTPPTPPTTPAVLPPAAEPRRAG